LESDFSENKHSQKGKHFPGNQTKFFFDWKVFFVDRKVFLLTGKCFLLTGKCFPLTNFSNNKQTPENFKNNFLKTTFEETNITLGFYTSKFSSLNRNFNGCTSSNTGQWIANHGENYC
jgi:hypothetical protein